MAASSYDEALARLLVHEGGYSNHPSDPGGPTNWGITIFDYRKYVNPQASAADVRSMPVEVAKKIYRDKYWNAMSCDELPAGIDYCVFDYGVNSGIGRAAKILRRVLGLPEKPGTVSDEVIAAAGGRDPKTLIDAICDERLAFLQSLRTWDVFGNGWGRRVREVRAAALAIAREEHQGVDARLRGLCRKRPEAGQSKAKAQTQVGDTPPPAPAPKPEPTPGAPAKACPRPRPGGRPPPVPAHKKFGWAAAVVAAIGAIAHWLDAHPITTIAAVVLAALVALFVTKGRSRPS
jgi:lysozyme family protein